MSTSWILWCAPALLLFWGLGAYNRLVRLRSDAVSAFAEFDVLLGKQVDFVRSSLPGGASPAAADPGQPPELQALWTSMQAAATQLSTSLAAARPRPLDAGATAMLNAARDVVDAAWDRVRGDAHDLAGSAVPDSMSALWQLLEAQTRHARERFNQAVGRYNAAIAQFPAVLLSWLFGFRRAGTL